VQFIIVLGVMASVLQADKFPITFNHIATEDGLSSNSVNAIIQDSDGFMWFGTRFGLNRYDGTQFRVYQHNPLNEDGLPGYEISALAEDEHSAIWDCERWE